MNRYGHTFAARCPANGLTIRYRLTLTTAAMVRVEDIVAACAAHEEGFHEAIADDLAKRLGGLHVLKAHHHGVDIETRRGG